VGWGRFSSPPHHRPTGHIPKDDQIGLVTLNLSTSTIASQAIYGPTSCGRGSTDRATRHSGATGHATTRKNCWSQARPACHMLVYLHLCAVNKIVVVAYEDACGEEMAEAIGSPGAFARIDVKSSPPRATRLLPKHCTKRRIKTVHRKLSQGACLHSAGDSVFASSLRLESPGLGN
jgi:hypothetical protein